MLKPTPRPTLCQQSIFSQLEPEAAPPFPDTTTDCERAAIALYGGRLGHCLDPDRIKADLMAAGHGRNTVDRTIASLRRHKVLVVRPDGLMWTGAGVPPRKKSFSRPNDETALNRFSQESKSDQAKLVQAVLIDRIEAIMERPTSQLARVGLFLEAGDRLARAVEGKSEREIEKWLAAMKILRRWLVGRDTGKIVANDLNSAILVAFFPDEYLEDPEVAAEIAADRQRRQDSAAALQFEATAHSVQIAKENERIDAENAALRKMGAPESEMKPRLENKPEAAIAQIGSIDQLVPASGGGRLGRARLEAFLETYGASCAAADEVAEAIRLTREREAVEDAD